MGPWVPGGALGAPVILLLPMAGQILPSSHYLPLHSVLYIIIRCIMVTLQGVGGAPAISLGPSVLYTIRCIMVAYWGPRSMSGRPLLNSMLPIIRYIMVTLRENLSPLALRAVLQGALCGDPTVLGATPYQVD